MARTGRSKQYRRNSNTKSAYKRLYSHQRAKAKYRGHDWNLSIQSWYKLVKSDCYLCGSRPSNVFKPVKDDGKCFGTSFVYNGLDRTDNTKGYIDGNVAPCCSRCNAIKSNQSLSGLAKHIKKIQNIGVLDDLKSFIRSLKKEASDEDKKP